jgi:hypothetical protein
MKPRLTHTLNSTLFFALLISNVIGLTACTGRIDANEKLTTQPTEAVAVIRLSGVLTLRGPQIEAWWGVRAQDGKLWRLVPESIQIKEDFQRLNNQAVQLEGNPLNSPELGSASADFPMLQVTRVLKQNPP